MIYGARTLGPPIREREPDPAPQELGVVDAELRVSAEWRALRVSAESRALLVSDQTRRAAAAIEATVLAVASVLVDR